MQNVDFSDFRNKSKIYKRRLHKNSVDILRECAVAFSKKASLYCPPNMGQKRIEKKHYTRPIFYLIDQVKKHNRTEDKQQLKKGMMFKVEIKKNGRFIKAIFAKTIRAIKKYTRIRNRGLFRSMFGANLGSIGKQIPSNIKSLLSKSKNLLNLANLNQIKQTAKNNEYAKIKIDNNAYNNESFADIAVKHGDKQAEKKMKKLLKEQAKKEVEL